ncbi:hypothetical protein [Azospirillum halopraeferens]|uniref:hypothetical protein n=1 Tax=Azospirillum halopraeferens TaxID=34010 RepID=UPI000404D28F|nr:hypothetical protein [Azospirillum halopraeferens]
MSTGLTLDSLIALDDRPAREMAYRTLAGHLLSAPALRPLFPSRDPVHPPAADAEWVDAVAEAALQLWLSSSGIGWLADDPVSRNPAATLDGLLEPDRPGHRATAEALYRWALPSHGHGGGTVLMAYVADSAGRWGERLADRLTGAEARARAAAAGPSGQAEEITRIAGILEWLAPERVPAVMQALAGSPMPPGTGFRFRQGPLLDHFFPTVAEAINRRLTEGTLTRLCGYTLASSLGGESALVEPEEPVARLTATVLRERFAELSPAERRMLGDALVRALPILRKAVGGFIEPTIRGLASPQD